MDQEARLRLVADNSSSAVSDTPRSRAISSKVRCHLPGMWPRLIHCSTAFVVPRPSSSASAAAPPNLRTTSLTCSISELLVRKIRRGQELFAPSSRNRKLERLARSWARARNSLMRVEPLSKSEYQRVVFERFEELLERMGRDDTWLKELLLDDLRRESTGADSSAKKIVEGWFKRKLLPDYWRYVLSVRLGVDEEWLAGKHDDLDGTADPRGIYSYEAKLRELRKA